MMCAMPDHVKSWVAVAESQWASRLRERITGSVAPVAVYAPRKYGLEYVVGSLHSTDRPLVWVTFDDLDGGDAVSQGVRLSEAVERALGAATLGFGLSFADSLRRLHETHDLLGPYVFCISGLDSAASLGGAEATLCALAHAGSPVVIHVGTSSLWGEFDGAEWVTCLEEDFALVRPAEKPDLSGDRVLSLAADSVAQPLYDVLMDALPSQERASFLIPSPVGAELLHPQDDQDALPPSALASALLSRGRPMEALEVLVRSGLGADDSTADAAGREYSRRGLLERAFKVFGAMPRAKRWTSDVLMRWYFASASAVNRHAELKQEVSEYLAVNRAPELRALFAAAFPGAEFLDEATRAVSDARTPTTLRIKAFAELLQGSPEVAVDHLHSALRLSERLGDDSMVVATATDLSDFWSREGAYREAITWAEWALDWYWRTGCRDELRRGVAASMLQFNRLLAGDEPPDRNSIEPIDEGVAGIPTTEVMLSTAAEVALVSGDLNTAERFARSVVDLSHTTQFPGAAVDLVHVLRIKGDTTEAIALGERALSMSRTMRGTPRILGRLAHAIATVDLDPQRADRELESVVVELAKVQEAPRLAQASIYWALSRLKSGSESGADEALQHGAKALRGLGATGWLLLGGPSPDVHRLRRNYVSDVQDVELSFMGSTQVSIRGARVELGMRQLEVLVALAQSPKGLTAEQLGILVYGDKAYNSTIKAIVSRLRQVVPVSSKPYRVIGGVMADFVQIQTFIASGRVREAVSLYRGALLPASDAPVVVELRDHLDELVRSAALESGDLECLISLAEVVPTDAQLLDAIIDRLSTQDPRAALFRARRTRIERDWSLG